MKIVCVYVLVIVIPLIGGCTEQGRSDTKVLAEPGTRYQKGKIGSWGPVITDDYYVIPYPAYQQMVLNIQRTLAEIDFKAKDVKKALGGAGKKVPVSGDLDIRRKLDEIDLKLTDVRAALDIAGKRVPIFGDIVQIINYLRPKLTLEVDPNALCSDKKIRMTFNITNRGEHSVSIGDIQLTLSTDKDVTTGESLPDMVYRESLL